MQVHGYLTVRDAHQGVARYMNFYNQIRPHRTLDGCTPDRGYWKNRRPHSLPLCRPSLLGITYEPPKSVQL